MDFDTATTDGAAALLKSYVSGERGRALRVQLAARYPECSDEEIEDAVQGACQCFLDEADDISEPGKAYAWLRTAAHRILGHDAKRQHREVPMDPAVGGRLESVAIDKTGPVEELIALEDDADLDALVRVVTTSLSDRRRDVLALYGVGLERTQIAERLGLPERTVKRDIREIVDRARSVVTRLAGGGCQRGEPLVVRLVCGISTPDESAQAREHLSRCGRCEAFCERLSAWREKAGAMLPAPVAEGASPGVLGRLAHKTTDGLSSLKQHVLDGGAQIKQHAATTYYRAVDPTPLAAARPGTVGAVIASCVAIGGGATYCAHQGIVDSIGAAAAGLIASESEDEPKPATTPPGAESTGPEYTPAEPPAEEAPAPGPTSEPPPSEPHHERPKVEAPPEDSFEPVAPSYTGGEAEPEAYEPPPAEPAPVPAGSPPQFGGP